MPTKIILGFALISFILVNGFAQAAPQDEAKEILRTNDLNKDQKLSSDEVDLAFKLRRFKKVDLNKDGFLDEAELIQSYQNAALARSQASQQVQSSPLDKILNRSTALKASNQKHTVEQGESLYGISKKYNVQLQNLKQINSIEDENKLPIGKVLIIPSN